MSEHFSISEHVPKWQPPNSYHAKQDRKTGLHVRNGAGIVVCLELILLLRQHRLGILLIVPLQRGAYVIDVAIEKLGNVDLATMK